jgi:hypothetical protein
MMYSTDEFDCVWSDLASWNTETDKYQEYSTEFWWSDEFVVVSKDNENIEIINLLS